MSALAEEKPQVSEPVTASTSSPEPQNSPINVDDDDEEEEAAIPTPDDNEEQDDGIDGDESTPPSSPAPSSVASSKEATTTSTKALPRLPPSAKMPTSVTPGVLSQALTMAAARQIMFDNYTPWIMRTYGDSAKTKTITTKKYARIVNLLRSLEQHHKDSSGDSTGSEVAKFRLWVKSKGFHLGPPAGHPDYGKPEATERLYLPTGTDKVSSYNNETLINISVTMVFSYVDNQVAVEAISR